MNEGATNMKRFYPVVIGRYLGDYTGRFTCWSIADHGHANRTSGEKFNTREQAQARADEMNRQEGEGCGS